MIQQFRLAFIDEASYEPLNVNNVWLRKHHIDNSLTVTTNEGMYAGMPVYVFDISYPKFEIMVLKSFADAMDDSEVIGFIRREVEHAIRKQRDLEIQLSDLYRGRTLQDIRSIHQGEPIRSGGR
jgi:hypothetical protein